jgi:hypothetical protein
MPNAQPKRCSWVNVDHVLMREYHDREWGVPVHDVDGSASAANEPDPAAVVGSANDKSDAIVQERVWRSVLGWGFRVTGCPRGQFRCSQEYES